MTTPAQVFQAVAAAFGVQDDFASTWERTNDLAFPRFAAWKIIREHCPFISLVKIGKMSGDRDHGTIIHGLKRAEVLLILEPKFRACYDEAMKSLNLTTIYT